MSNKDNFKTYQYKQKYEKSKEKIYLNILDGIVYDDLNLWGYMILRFLQKSKSIHFNNRYISSKKIPRQKTNGG